MVAAVAADVKYLVVVLADGQTVKEIPVAAYGGRFVAFAAPLSDRVLSSTAYFQDGQFITAVPFTQDGGLPDFGLWAAPGQPVPPTATAVLGSGTANGQHWSVTAYEGPWGTCVTSATGPGNDESTACQSTDRITSLTLFGVGDFGSGLPFVVDGFAPLAATRLEVTLTDGRSFGVPVMSVGNERLWAFALEKGQADKSWTAYSASGKPLGTGGCSSCAGG